MNLDELEKGPDIHLKRIPTAELPPNETTRELYDKAVLRDAILRPISTQQATRYFDEGTPQQREQKEINKMMKQDKRNYPQTVQDLLERGGKIKSTFKKSRAKYIRKHRKSTLKKNRAKYSRKHRKSTFKKSTAKYSRKH